MLLDWKGTTILSFQGYVLGQFVEEWLSWCVIIELELEIMSKKSAFLFAIS